MIRPFDLMQLIKNIIKSMLNFLIRMPFDDALALFYTGKAINIMFY